jgi:hypothetical protein
VGQAWLVELARLERVDWHIQMQMEEDEGYEGAKGVRAELPLPRC